MSLLHKILCLASKLSQWYKKKVATHLWAAQFGWGRNFCILNLTLGLTGCMASGKPFDLLFFPILPHCMATDFVKETSHVCDGPKLWNDIYRWHCVWPFHIHNCPTSFLDAKYHWFKMDMPNVQILFRNGGIWRRRNISFCLSWQIVNANSNANVNNASNVNANSNY